MSDNTGSPPDKPDKPVKVKRINRDDWPLIRNQYETGSISYRKLAKVFSVPLGTLVKRARREHWVQQSRCARATVTAIDQTLSTGIQSALREIAQAEAAKLLPWIEERKTAIVKRGYALYDRGADRIEKLWDENQPTDTKKESEAARAVETLVRVGRTSLGMGDNQQQTGAFSLSILAGNAAVQVVSPKQLPNESTNAEIANDI